MASLLASMPGRAANGLLAITPRRSEGVRSITSERKPQGALDGVFDPLAQAR
jgi:hypothetical protein